MLLGLKFRQHPHFAREKLCLGFCQINRIASLIISASSIGMARDQKDVFHFIHLSILTQKHEQERLGCSYQPSL